MTTQTTDPTTLAPTQTTDPTTLAPTQSTTPPSALNSAAPLPWEDPATVPTPPAAAQATPALVASTAQAAPATVNPNALSDQVNQVADPNSEISQLATAQANADSNSKGLLNSSMAVGAARNAVLQAALPIAQGDVAAQEQNASNAQQASLQNAQQTNAVGTVNAQSTTSVNQSNAAATNAQIMAQLAQANQVQMAGVNAQYSNFLNSNGTASSLYNNTMTQISQIQNNPNLDAASKTDAITQLTSLLQAGLSNMSAISGLNLSAGLDFGGSTNPVPLSTAATATPTSNMQGNPGGNNGNNNADNNNG